MDEVLAALQQHHELGAVAIEAVDGLSLEFADWRFNLRASQTEPLLRRKLRNWLG